MGAVALHQGGERRFIASGDKSGHGPDPQAGWHFRSGNFAKCFKNNVHPADMRGSFVYVLETST